MPGGWGAFLLTFAWLRARRLRAWSWAYLPLSTPFVLALWLFAFAGDACQRELAGWGPGVHAVFATLLAFGWIAPPLVIARLQRRGMVQAPTGRMWLPVAAQLLLIAVPAVLLPSYASYGYRARVSDALAEISGLRPPVSEALLSGRAPSVAFAPSPRLKSVEVSREGAIKAVLAGPGLEGRTLVNSPIRGSGGIEWTCSSDLPDACLPAACRR